MMSPWARAGLFSAADVREAEADLRLLIAGWLSDPDPVSRAWCRDCVRADIPMLRDMRTSAT